MAKIEKEIFWPKLEPEAEKKGLKVLAVWENGFRQITNSKRPIKVSRPISQGIKLRVPEGQVAGEDVPGLRRQSEPDEVLRGLHRAADRRDGRRGEPAHADLFGEVPGSAEVSVADRPRLHARVSSPSASTQWDALPADVRKILEDTAKETQAFVYEIAATKDDDELLGKLKQAGMQVNEVDKDAFIAASKPIYEEFGKEVPAPRS